MATFALLRRATLLVATISLALSTTAPAHAATLWGYDDVRGDARFGIDIRRTTLDVRDPGMYRVRVLGYEFIRERLNVVTVYFDTRSANAGPEYTLSWGLPHDGVWNDPDDVNYDRNDYRAGLYRVDSWNAGSVQEVSCPGIRLRRDLARDIVTLKFPRVCLGRPSRLRWNVQTERVVRSDQDGSYEYYFDASPAFRRFGRDWVA